MQSERHTLEHPVLDTKNEPRRGGAFAASRSKAHSFMNVNEKL